MLSTRFQPDGSLGGAVRRKALSGCLGRTVRAWCGDVYTLLLAREEMRGSNNEAVSSRLKQV